MSTLKYDYAEGESDMNKVKNRLPDILPGCISLPFLFLMVSYRFIGHMAGVRFLSGETLLQAKKLHGHRCDSNPGSCRHMAIAAR